MYFVYFLRSLTNLSKKYIGYTTNLKKRLADHNAGNSLHTQHNRPWKLITFIAFDSKDKAIEFENYVKVGSGAAFAKRRFW